MRNGSLLRQSRYHHTNDGNEKANAEISSNIESTSTSNETYHPVLVLKYIGIKFEKKV